jgi:hypothetical protein
MYSNLHSGELTWSKVDTEIPEIGFYYREPPKDKAREQFNTIRCVYTDPRLPKRPLLDSTTSQNWFSHLYPKYGAKTEPIYLSDISNVFERVKGSVVRTDVHGNIDTTYQNGVCVVISLSCNSGWFSTDSPKTVFTNNITRQQIRFNSEDNKYYDIHSGQPVTPLVFNGTDFVIPQLYGRDPMMNFFDDFDTTSPPGSPNWEGLLDGSPFGSPDESFYGGKHTRKYKGKHTRKHKKHRRKSKKCDIHKNEILSSFTLV